jgi:hypothetical protein
VTRPQGAGCDAGAVEVRPARLVAGGPLALGTVLVGDRGTVASTTVTNAGDRDATIATVGLTGPAAAEVEPAAGNCADGQVLAPGASCTLGAALAPTAPGAKDATFSIAFTAPAQDLVVPVAGAGQARPVDPIVPDDPADPGSPPADPGSPPPQASATTTLLGLSSRAKANGRFSVRLRCAAAGAPRCSGVVTLRLGAKRLSRVFAIAAGRTATVKLRLAKGDRRKLSRRALRSAVTVVTAQPDGSRRTTHKTTLKLLRSS